MKSNINYRIATIIFFTVAHPMVAFAQSTASLPASPGAEAGDENGLDIVVVARKRTESAQKVPISISAFSQDQLADQRIERVTDLIGRVPGMTSDGGGNILGAIGLRGIVSVTRNIGFDSGLGVYVDGVLTVRPTMANQELPDIASVEVLRGPQGTLFGRNTTAGAINITTRKAALDDATGDFRAGVGNLGTRQASAFITAPLIEDKLGFKLTGYTNNRDGYIFNQTLDRKENSIHHSGVRGGLRWKPVDTLEIEADGSYMQQRDRTLRGQLLDDTTGTLAGLGGVFRDPYVVQQENPSFQNIEAATGRLAINWELENGMSVTSISAYGKIDTDFQNDDDARPLRASASHFQDTSKQFTQELRLASRAGGTFDYLIGAYYFWQDSTSDRSTFVNATPLAAPNIGFITSQSRVKTDAYALFASANLRPLDGLEIAGGIRYNHEKKWVDFRQGDTSVTRLPTINTIQSSSFNAVTGNLSVTYAIVPQARVYASLARGFKSGGYNADIVSLPTIGFGPEHVWTYEAGIKSEPFGGMAHVNLSAYQSDLSDLQVSQLFANAFQIRNAGKSRIRGVELEVIARPVPGFDINFAAGYTDAKFTEFDLCAAATSCAGNRLPYVPKWTLTAGIQYKVELDDGATVTPRLDWSYRSSSFSDILNRAPGIVEGYDLFNARLAYDFHDERFGVALWMKNVFDKRYKEYATFLAPYRYWKVSWAVPRTYGVDIHAKF